MKRLFEIDYKRDTIEVLAYLKSAMSNISRAQDFAILL